MPRGVGTETPLPALGRTVRSRGLGAGGGLQGWLHLQVQGQPASLLSILWLGWGGLQGRAVAAQLV